jgi:formiminoglutamase
MWYPYTAMINTKISKGTDGDVVLVGFPFDEGVRRNGGRVGAKLGPSTMRGCVLIVFI